MAQVVKTALIHQDIRKVPKGSQKMKEEVLLELSLPNGLKKFARALGVNTDLPKGDLPKYIKEKQAELSKMRHFARKAEESEDTKVTEDDFNKWKKLLISYLRDEKESLEEIEELVTKLVKNLVRQRARYIGKGPGDLNTFHLWISTKTGKILAPDRKGIKVIWNTKFSKNAIYWTEENIKDAKRKLSEK